MNFKRVAHFILVGSMLLSVLSGCGTKTATKIDDKDQTPIDQIKVEGYNLPISDSNLQLTYAGPDNWYASASYSDGLEVWKEFEKRTGVKIKFEVMQDSQYNTSMQTRVAANQGLPDIIAVPPLWNGDVVKYSNSGVIIPLNRLIKQYAPNIQKMFEQYPELRRSVTAADGEIYTIPESVVQMNDNNFNMPIVREDWLAKLSLKTPETWDEWYTVLKAFKEQDPNGNSKADEIPFYTESIGKAGFFGASLGLQMSDTGFMVTKEGKVSYIPATQEYKEVLQFINKLYSEGLMDIELGSSKKDEFINQDILGAHTHWSVITTRFNANLQKAGIDGKYKAILPTKDASGNTIVTRRAPFSLEYAITKDCKDPISAIKWIDYVWASDEGLLLQSAGIEGKSYEIKDGKPVLTDWTLKHPNQLDPLNALRSLGAGGSVLYNQSWEIGRQLYEEEALAFGDIAKPYMVEGFPRLLGTIDEDKRAFAILADMQTYSDEMVMKFALGREPFENFDKFVNTLNSMGLEELIQIKQTQYDRLK